MIYDIGSLLSLVIVYALIDSIDPCMYALYASLLASFIANTRKLMAMAITFLLSIFLGYLMFNTILKIVLFLVAPPRWILSIALSIYGLLIILYTIFFSKNRNIESYVCREDRLLCKFLNIIKIDLSTLSLIGIAALGFITSFTVLPCSAGMAIAFNVITRNLGFIAWIPLAILYTLIFILPLIALTLVVLGLAKIGAVYKYLLENQVLIKIFGGSLMLIVAILIGLGKL
ncbi:MAG: hypothetical protein QXL96_06640 [Ignisphaera sp.]